MSAEINVKYFLAAFKELRQRGDVIHSVFSNVLQDGIELKVSDLEALLEELEKVRNRANNLSWELNPERMGR